MIILRSFFFPNQRPYQRLLLIHHPTLTHPHHRETREEHGNAIFSTSQALKSTPPDMQKPISCHCRLSNKKASNKSLIPRCSASCGDFDRFSVFTFSLLSYFVTVFHVFWVSPRMGETSTSFKGGVSNSVPESHQQVLLTQKVQRTRCKGRLLFGTSDTKKWVCP